MEDFDAVFGSQSILSEGLKMSRRIFYLSSLFMQIPVERLAALGRYPVGGALGRLRGTGGTLLPLVGHPYLDMASSLKEPAVPWPSAQPECIHLDGAGGGGTAQ